MNLKYIEKYLLMATKELLEKIFSEKITPEENLKEKLKKIEEKEREINAFITITENFAKNQIKNLKKGKLYGLILGVKDNFCIKNIRTTCASKMSENYVPDYTATVVERLLNEGCILIGKLNMDEFACGSSGETSYFGPTRNPLNLEWVPGGSSSGCGAAIQAGFCDITLGSDTGGSIRCPASFCGVVGFKPSYGVSRYGLIDMAMSLDVPGFITKDVYGSALMFEICKGEDIYDCNSMDFDFEISYLEEEVDFKIFFSEKLLEKCDEYVKKGIKEVLNVLEKKYHVDDVNLEFLDIALPTYYLTVYTEFSSAMQKYDGFKYGYREKDSDLINTVMENRKVFGKEVKRRILLGTYISMKEFKGKYYTKALVGREFLRKKFNELFENYDIFFLPTMPTIPFKLGEKINDPIKMYLSDIFTVIANLIKSPAISIPVFVEDKPVGAQFLGKWKDDKKVLNIGYKVENLIKIN